MTETIKTQRGRNISRRTPTGPIDRAIADEPIDLSSPASDIVVIAVPSDAEMFKRPTKVGLVQALLARDDGASLDELREATGWLPHSCRALLTRLRKQGQSLKKRRRDDGVTVYHLAPVEGAA